MEKAPKRLARPILAGAAMAVFAGLAALFIEHEAGVTLPAPTGSFAVGRDVYDWVDAEGSDPVAPAPGIRRELLVWIWYPADGKSGALDDYIPSKVLVPAGRDDLPLLFRLLTADASKVRGHSLRDAAVAPGSFPVAVLRAGGSSDVANYSALAEDLASHGYVVVGLDAPYRTRRVVFPDGRVIDRTPENNPELVFGDALERRGDRLLDAWTADVGFVLDRLQQLNANPPSGKFAGRLDMTRVGLFGHSFGGATAADFCSRDSRCKAGIDIDGALHGSVLRTGIQRPFLFLLSGNGDFSSGAENRKIMAEIQSVYDRLPAESRLRVVIRGANHFTFSDDGALRKSALFRGVLRLFGRLSLGGRRQVIVTAYCIRSFFDAYLKPTHALPPALSTAAYPEIQIIR